MRIKWPRGTTPTLRLGKTDTIEIKENLTGTQLLKIPSNLALVQKMNLPTLGTPITISKTPKTPQMASQIIAKTKIDQTNITVDTVENAPSRTPKLVVIKTKSITWPITVSATAAIPVLPLSLKFMPVIFKCQYKNTNSNPCTPSISI